MVITVFTIIGLWFLRLSQLLRLLDFDYYNDWVSAITIITMIGFRNFYYYNDWISAITIITYVAVVTVI
jgi:hypothetical protein